MARIDVLEESVGQELTRREILGTPSDDGFFWAGEPLSFREACKHFVAIGATGTGKSITLNMLLQSVLTKMGRKDGIKRRALVYDPKADMVNFIAGHVPAGVKVRILNPMDARFSPWNIGADILTESDALEFASILIPKNERESSPYFSDGARSLISGVIKRLIASAEPKGNWNLRDVILAFESKETLKLVLSHRDTKYLLEHFEEANEKNFAGVKSTVDTALAIYRPIAALMHAATEDVAAKRSLGPKDHSPHSQSRASMPNKVAEPGPSPIDSSPISLKEWLEEKGDSVLVLGNHENAREATDTINRIIFRQLSKLLIARNGEINGDQTWIFLDEVREAGKLNGLRQLLLRGRSKGVAVAMGFQDVEGMYAVYGKHEGAEIIGAAQNLVILHINASAPDTAEWASRVFGSRRVSQLSYSMEHLESKVSSSHQMQVVPSVYPIQFTQLEMPSPETGLDFFAFTNRYKQGYGSYDWNFLETEGPLQRLITNVDDFETQTDARRMNLKQWEVDIFQRLKFEVLPAPKLNAATPTPVSYNGPSSLDNLPEKTPRSHPLRG